MQAFVVRPVMTGLLALIIMGLCGTSPGTRAGGLSSSQAGCRMAATEAPAGTAGAMIRRSGRC
jgi:hypothetical protein